MGKEIPIVSVTSVKDSLDQLDTIIDIYKEVGVLVLRGCKFSLEDQILITSKMGDVLGWNFYTDILKNDRVDGTYLGGHSDNPDANYSHGKDQYKLDWHIEQVFYIDPVLAGIWNMTHFSAEPDAGTTRFADSIEIYESLSIEDQDFLDKSVVIWEKPMGQTNGPFYTNVVAPHPISGKPTLRVEMDHGCYRMPELHFWNGGIPSKEQVDRFNSIWGKIKGTLTGNVDIRYVQYWQEGDMLIVDLFRMYHAVMGGFNYGERTFTGIGVRPKGFTHDLYISEDLV